MSTIPYNYGKYIDDKVAMSNSGTVDAGRQVQSPASAGSRGLAKTTQFTKDPTQMKMGNSPIAESMIEIRNILNRIDGVNVPVKEDNMRDLAIHDIEAQLGKINDEITFLQIDQKDKESALAALGELRSVLDKYQSQQESAVNELADDDKIEFTKVMLDISQIKDRVEALSVDDEAKASAIQSLTNAEEALVALDETQVREDASDQALANEIAKIYDDVVAYLQDVSDNPADDQGDLRSGYDGDDVNDAEDLAAAFRKDFKTGMALQKQLQADREKEGEGRVDVWDPFNPESIHYNQLKALMSKAKGESVAESKPDFLDMDKDGNKTEPMKKAIKDKEAKEDTELTAIKKLAGI